jgi:hypothetical protein
MWNRLKFDYEEQESFWPQDGPKILKMVKYAGRLAATFDPANPTRWRHAMPALKAVKDGCTDMPQTRGRHCAHADFTQLNKPRKRRTR